MDLGQGLAAAGDSIAEGMQAYHKEHVAYDNADQLLQAFSRMGINEQGNLANVIGPDGKAQKGITPIIDPAVIETLKAKVGTNRAKATGAMEALAKLGYATAGKAISSRIEDQSLSGQRTRQIMAQSEQSFPLEQQAREDTHKHMQALDEQAGKIDVPGYGLMTPPQKSAHDARIARSEALAKKMEPASVFQNALQTKYGIGTQDIVDALKPQEFTAGGKKYTGTPFYDSTGNIVSAAYAQKKPEETFVHVGKNNVAVPLFDKEHGLGWTQITGKAQALLPQVQAQQVIARIKLKDPDELTDQDQAAFNKAKQILSQ